MAMNNILIKTQCKKIKDIKSNILLLKKHKINVICKTPLNSITENSFSKILNWCNKNNISYYYSSELFNSYDGSDNTKYKLKDKELIKLIKNGNNSLLKQVDYVYGKKYFLIVKRGNMI